MKEKEKDHESQIEPDTTLTFNRPTSVSTGGAADEVMVPRRSMQTVRNRIDELNFRQDWPTNLFWVCLGLIPALGFSFIQSLQVQALSASTNNLVVAVVAGSLFFASIAGAVVAHMARKKVAETASWQKRHVLEDFDTLMAPHQHHQNPQQ
jgi:hypothetical protein